MPSTKVICEVIALLAAAVVAPAALPVPTGNYRVGTCVRDLVDQSRVDPGFPEHVRKRELVVQIWYPSNESGGAATPYIPRLKTYKPTLSEKDYNYLSGVQTHAVADAKPIKGRLPVVVFSHGWSETRSYYSCMAEELASHGFFVVGIDHPFLGTIALQDGFLTKADDSQYATPQESMNYLAKDVLYVIDWLGEKSNNTPVTRQADVGRLAVLGHSSGFDAAGTAANASSKIKALINVDAGSKGMNLDNITQSVLWIKTARAATIPAEVIAHKKQPLYFASVADAKHSSITDYGILDVDQATFDRSLTLIRGLSSLIRGFLDESLRGKTGATKKASADSKLRVELTVH